MISLSVHVVGHVARERQAVELAVSLGATLHMDNGTLGVYGNHRRALTAAAESGRQSALVVEDDALPCTDLLDAAEWYAEQRPDHMLGLYVGRSKPRGLQHAIERWIAEHDSTEQWLDAPAIQRRLWWGVGYVVPTADIPNVITTADRTCGLADLRLGAWHHRNRRVSYPWPSLVDHADVPSVNNESIRRPTGRVAWMVR